MCEKGSSTYISFENVDKEAGKKLLWWNLVSSEHQNRLINGEKMFYEYESS